MFEPLKFYCIHLYLLQTHLSNNITHRRSQESSLPTLIIKFLCRLMLNKLVFFNKIQFDELKVC